MIPIENQQSIIRLQNSLLQGPSKVRDDINKTQSQLKHHRATLHDLRQQITAEQHKLPQLQAQYGATIATLEALEKQLRDENRAESRIGVNLAAQQKAAAAILAEQTGRIRQEQHCVKELKNNIAVYTKKHYKKPPPQKAAGSKTSSRP